MALRILHKFVSGKGEGPDPTKVQGQHWDADHDIIDTNTGLPIVASALSPVGTIIDYAGHSPPAGWLECAGQSLAGAAYPALYAALVKFGSTISITVSNPAVISWEGHYMLPGSIVWFGVAAGGTLPGGITPGAIYYVSFAGWAVDSFRITASYNGPDIATTTLGSGTPYAVHAPFGANGTNFNLPDLREAVTAAHSNAGWTGGPLPTRLSANYAVGEGAGYEGTALSIANMPAHSHGGVTGNQSVNHTHTVAGSGSGSGVTDTQGGHTHTFSGDHANNSSGSGGLERIQRLQTGNTGDQDREVSAGGEHAHNFTVNISVSGGTSIENIPHQHGIAVEGSGTPFPIIQPTLFIRKIIYTGL